MKFGKIFIMGIVAVTTIIISDAAGTILIIIIFSVVNYCCQGYCNTAASVTVILLPGLL